VIGVTGKYDDGDRHTEHKEQQEKNPAKAHDLTLLNVSS